MVRIHSTIESIATKSTALATCSRSDEAQRKGRFVSTQVTDEPTLTIDSDPRQPGSDCVSVHNLHPDLITSLGKHPEAGRLLQSILRVRVIDAGMPGGEDIPDVFGRHVCGNSLLAAFDRPLRSAGDLTSQSARRSMSFHLV
jgi:hypothetical protein